MKIPLFSIAFVLFILVIFEIYVYQGIQSLFSSGLSKKILLVSYGTVTFIAYFGMFRSTNSWDVSALSKPAHITILSGFALVLLVTKLIFAFTLVFHDAGRLLWALVMWLNTFLNENASAAATLEPRRKFITWTSLGLVSIPFFSMLHGITRGKYNYTIENIKIKDADLPKSFNGFKIVQISDIHSGSWDDIASVSKGIEKIRDQKPDLIVFTGDLVNRHKNEIDPFIHLFQSLEAPFGKFAVLGNHDYYGQPRDADSRRQYWDDFYIKYRQMGFDLLMNESRNIKIENDHIALLGVENWGLGQWFPKRGDLNKALEGIPGDQFCILLSHDPTHWDEKIIPHDKHIHLTLSGHTHGMQFGINLPGFKWSPIQYRYKKWMGLYQTEGQSLYVNRGFGFLGFPGRVGMFPEISVFTLESEST